MPWTKRQHIVALGEGHPRELEEMTPEELTEEEKDALAHFHGRRTQEAALIRKCSGSMAVESRDMEQGKYIVTVNAQGEITGEPRIEETPLRKVRVDRKAGTVSGDSDEQ